MKPRQRPFRISVSQLSSNLIQGASLIYCHRLKTWSSWVLSSADHRAHNVFSFDMFPQKVFPKTQTLAFSKMVLVLAPQSPHTCSLFTLLVLIQHYKLDLLRLGPVPLCLRQQTVKLISRMVYNIRPKPGLTWSLLDSKPAQLCPN